MAGHPWNILCCILLDSMVGAVILPNRTYLPDNFGKGSIRTIVGGLRLIYRAYKVKTADGYLLTLNRIINPDKMYAANLGVPVLFVNGMAMHSEAWLLQTKPEMNLPIAYLLEGYDVWLGDQRGTIRSREHVTMNAEDWRFWDFSFHETGVFDLPAFIDFILKTTGHPKLVYSGLSLGGAFYYVMCTERPEYQDKLYGGILWQPVGAMPSIDSMPWRLKMKILTGQHLLGLEWTVGMGEAPPFNRLWRKIMYTTCLLSRIGAQHTARLFLGQGCQFGEEICLQLTSAMGGTSAKTILHTIQLFRNGGVFNQYNYGPLRNYFRYGRFDPPTYDMRRLRVFTALYSSDIDIFTPTWTEERFSTNFSGLTYACEMQGVCHGFIALDHRALPHVRDSVEVLNSMTGRTSYHKMASGRCYVQRP